MSDGQVVIDITADDREFKSAMGGLGKAAVAGVAVMAAAFLGAGIAALNMSNDFNKGMANVASLIPGNIDRVNELKGVVQGMSVEFGKSTDDLSDGLYNVISAFGDTADTAAILETSVKAATAGVATTTDAINLTSAVTKAYGDTSAEAVGKASDLALLTVRLGQTTFPELAASIGKVTPLTNELGVSQEELFATMATLTGVTGGAAEVSTQFAGTLKALLNPTDSATEAFEAAGYASGRAAIESLGYSGAIGLLIEAHKKSGKPLQDFIASEEGVLAALALGGPQADVYAEKLAAMGDAAGATDAAFAEQAEGVNKLGFAFDQGKQLVIVAIQRIGDAIGSAFGPQIMEGIETARTFFEGFFAKIEEGRSPLMALRATIFETFGPEAGRAFDLVRGAVEAFAGAVRSVISWIQGNRGWLEPLAVGVLAMVVAFKAWQAAQVALAVVTKGLAAVQSVLNAVMAANPIGIIVLAVIGLVAALVYLWKTNEGFRNAVTKVWGAIKGTVLSVINWFKTAPKEAFEKVRTAAVNAFNGVVDFLKKWGPWVLAALGGPITLGIALWKKFGRQIVDGLKAGITNAWRSLVDKFKGLINLLPAAVKKILGISSPSRVFAKLGEQIGEGWAKGLEKSGKQVVGAVRSTASDLISAADSPVLRSAMEFTPAVAAGGSWRPQAGGVALATAGGGDVSTSSSEVNLNFYAPVTRYSDVVRGYRDAQRAAARR